jgi:hypothetical protein
LYLVANPYPCRPLAQSQLPHFKTRYPAPHPFSFPPSSRPYMQQLYTDDINQPVSSSVGHNMFCSWYSWVRSQLIFYWCIFLFVLSADIRFIPKHYHYIIVCVCQTYPSLEDLHVL